MEGSECDLFNQRVATAPTTNADRICATIERRLKDDGRGQAWEIIAAPSVMKRSAETAISIAPTVGPGWR